MPPAQADPENHVGKGFRCCPTTALGLLGLSSPAQPALGTGSVFHKHSFELNFIFLTQGKSLGENARLNGKHRGRQDVLWFTGLSPFLLPLSVLSDFPLMNMGAVASEVGSCPPGGCEMGRWSGEGVWAGSLGENMLEQNTCRKAEPGRAGMRAGDVNFVICVFSNISTMKATVFRIKKI